jgi:hypothetical protein
VETDNREIFQEKSLTCIRPPYTMAGTSDEAEKLMIKNFLNTLAEVSISIASRIDLKEEAER